MPEDERRLNGFRSRNQPGPAYVERLLLLSPLSSLLLRGGIAALDAARRVRDRGFRLWIRRERFMGLRMLKTAVAAALAWELARFLLAATAST